MTLDQTEELKTCGRCKVKKDFSEFYTLKCGKLYSWCRFCVKEANAMKANYRKAYYSENKERIKLEQAKYRHNIPFNLEKEDIWLPMACPILGIVLKKGVGKSNHHDASPSLDRVKPSIGYVRGNTLVMSHRANRLKNNATFEELKLLLHYMQGRLQKLQSEQNLY